MEHIPDIKLLQQSADYRSLRKLSRYTAVFGFIFGTFSLIAGIITLWFPLMGGFYSILGVVLLVMAVWMIASPNPKLLIVEGSSLLILGTVFILTSFFKIYINSSRGTEFSAGSGLIIWGIIIAVVGGRSIGSYKRFSGFLPGKPSKECSIWINEIVKNVEQANISSCENIFEFYKKAFTGTRRWKVLLLDEIAVLVQAGEKDMFVVRKDNVEFTKRNELSKGKRFAALLRVGSHTMNTNIDRDSYVKYEKWKSL